MAGFNKVILVGNLTRDPELRYTPKGLAIAKVGLAVNRVRRTETGEQREETTFVDIDVFGRTAEIVGQYLRKGSPALFEGWLRLDTWEDKSGQKRSKLTVVAETVQLLGARASVETTTPSQPDQQQLQQPSEAEPAGGGVPQLNSDSVPPEDDDVPF